MELFRIHKTIPFMKYSKILNAISFISFFIAIGLLVVRGLAFSIEFTGGLELRNGSGRADSSAFEERENLCSDERRGYERNSQERT